MSNYTQTTPTTRRVIVDRVDQGIPKKSIAEDLNIAPSTVTRIYQRYSKSRDWYAVTPGRGRKPKLSKKDLFFAKRKFYSGEIRNGAHLQRQYFGHVGKSTLRRALRNYGLEGHKRHRVPYISPAQRQMCISWANQFRFAPQGFWNQIIFSDESKFNLFGSDGDRVCRRLTGDALHPVFTQKQVKHGGGNVMVWGCITNQGVGHLVRVVGRMDKRQYVDILERGLLPTLEDYHLDLSATTFQEDNDPKHTSKLAKAFLKEKGIRCLPWPSGSPDMNIIEHVWGYLEEKVQQHKPHPSNLEQLWRILQEEWQKIPLGFIQNLYRSMGRRVTELHHRSGWNTKY